MARQLSFSADATIATALDGVKDPLEYVRRVLDNMRGLYGDCQVRLCLSSNAKYPDYAIEWLIFAEDSNEIIHAQTVCIVEGRFHKPSMHETEDAFSIWSNNEMSFKEVQILIGKLRAKAEATA